MIANLRVPNKKHPSVLVIEGLLYKNKKVVY